MVHHTTSFDPTLSGSLSFGGGNDSLRTMSTSGKVVVSGKETTYVGATHWAAILDDVRLFLALNMVFHLLIYCSID